MISVIVPVYNVEKYVAECIESVIRQTYTDWELILIDDGSSDDSGGICKEYADRDDRIRYFLTSNNGACSARNYGLDSARGEFIFFLDSDDVLIEDCFEYLIKTQIEKNVDIVSGSACVFREKKQYPPTDLHKDDTVDSNTFFNDLLNDNTIFSIWGKLYTKAVLDGIYFCPNQKMGQDIYFLYLLCLKKSFTIHRCSRAVYRYRLLKSSVSHGGNNAEKKDSFLHALSELFISEQDKITKICHDKFCRNLIGMEMHYIISMPLFKIKLTAWHKDFIRQLNEIAPQNNYSKRIRVVLNETDRNINFYFSFMKIYDRMADFVRRITKRIRCIQILCV